jgi:hypothetical protein
MDKLKECKVTACCSSHACEIIGAILIGVATLLTLFTLNGAGIFGMFLVGLVFCCHKHMSCKSCPCAEKGICDAVECDTPKEKRKK